MLLFTILDIKINLKDEKKEEKYNGTFKLYNILSFEISQLYIIVHDHCMS